MKHFLVNIILMTVFLTANSFAEVELEHGKESGHEHHDEHEPESYDSDEHEHESEHGGEHESEHEAEKNKGSKKAIIDIHDEGRRFKLSIKAKKILKLKHETISKIGAGTFLIQNQSLVRFGEAFGVFVYRDEWFELIEVKVESKGSKKNIMLKVSSKELKASDKIVVEGVPLLRVAQLEASGEGGEGHAH